MEKGARGPLFLLACELLELAPREKFYTTPPAPQFSWCGLRLTPTFGNRVGGIAGLPEARKFFRNALAFLLN